MNRSDVCKQQIRRVLPTEMKQAVRLADSVFRDYDPAKKSFGSSHPQLFHPGLCQSYGLYLDEKLVSFVGVVPSVVRIGNAGLNVLSIGGVCTDPNYRNRGYAGQILEQIWKHADLSGVSLIFVSGNRSLYMRANCLPFGLMHQMTIDSAAVAGLPELDTTANLKVRELEGTDWFGLWTAANTRECAFEQSLWDLALLLHAEPAGATMKQRHHVLVAEIGGTIKAYAVFGIPYPGTETVPRVFEWAGEAPIVSSLIADAFRRFGLCELTVPVAWYEQKFYELLKPAACQMAEVKNSGTIRIVSAERLVSQLRPYLLQKEPHLGGQLQLISTDDRTVRLSLADYHADLEISSLVSLLFDRNPGSDVNGDLPQALRSLFPIPLPFAGGLNFV